MIFLNVTPPSWLVGPSHLLTSMQYNTRLRYWPATLILTNWKRLIWFMLSPPFSLHNFMIRVNTDNAASQQVLSSGKGRDPVICACAHQLWLLATSFNFELEIIHKPGSELILADALSRSLSNPQLNSKARLLCNKLDLKLVHVSFSLDKI